MSRLIVRGPVELSGEVSVRGAKNAALPILIAAVISPEPVTLRNIPTTLNDVRVTLETLQCVGCRYEIKGNTVRIDGSVIENTHISEELSTRARSSLLFLGLLVGKVGGARISMPGGCNLGERKFDLHLEGLRKLGAEVRCDSTGIEVQAERLVGTDIDFYLPTTTGTENVMIAACFVRLRKKQNWITTLLQIRLTQAKTILCVMLITGLLMQCELIKFFFKWLKHSIISKKSAVISLIVNIPLNLFLIPKWGISGAAFASTVAYTLATVIVIIAFTKISKKSWSDVLLIKKQDFQDYSNLLAKLRAG